MAVSKANPFFDKFLQDVLCISYADDMLWEDDKELYQEVQELFMAGNQREARQLLETAYAKRLEDVYDYSAYWLEDAIDNEFYSVDVEWMDGE